MLRALQPSDGPKGSRFGPAAILDDLSERVPRYLNDVDQGKLIYPACRRALSDANGDVRSVWNDTRLEAIRYVMEVPGRGLTAPQRVLKVAVSKLPTKASAG